MEGLTPRRLGDMMPIGQRGLSVDPKGDDFLVIPVSTLCLNHSSFLFVAVFWEFTSLQHFLSSSAECLMILRDVLFSIFQTVPNLEGVESRTTAADVHTLNVAVTTD